jgi:glycosyltransferase involved in cell wall biosynthesis
VTVPPSLRILFATPAYWPATAFGGPTRAAKELTEGLVRDGHQVDVLTTSLRTVDGPPAARLRSERATVSGVEVVYLATPARYRWMGITPTLPFAWPWRHRPDIVHVFGYRDVVTTLTAAWARAMRVPYVFEPLDMFVPRFRNVPLKRAFDRALGEPVAHGADLVVACSTHEQQQLVEAGLPESRIRTRANGFPSPPSDGDDRGTLRARLGIAADEQLVLSVGRISFKKGLDLLIDAVAPLEGVHLALVGPDDGDGTLAALERQRTALGVQSRIHFVGPLDTSDPREVYGDADVFVLASRNESFGIVAAEAVACGVPTIVTDRCGVAEMLGESALVVPCTTEGIRDAIALLLATPELRAKLAAAGPEVARANSWDAMVTRQVELYRQVLADRA